MPVRVHPSLPTQPPKTPEVWSLVSPTGEARRATAERFDERLLKKAAECVGNGVRWFQTQVGLSNEQIRDGAAGWIGVGAGAAIKRLPHSEWADWITKGTSLSGQRFGTHIELLQETSKELFDGEFADSIGFAGFLPGIHRQKNALFDAIGGTFASDTPVIRADHATEFHRDLRVIPAVGKPFSLKVPSRLLAVPEGGSRNDPVSSRSVSYSFRGALLPPGDHFALQTGLGISPPDEIQYGRWFPSGKQGTALRPDGSSISYNPLLYVGRVAADEQGAAHVDLVLMGVNRAQGGLLDFIGLQTMGTELSRVLRWDLWQLFGEWSGISVRIATAEESVLEAKPMPIIVGSPRKSEVLEQARKAFAVLDDARKRFTDEDLKEFEQELRAAQKSPPKDKAKFVREVNRMLDAFGVRFMVNGKPLGRLRLVTKSTIQIKAPGRRSVVQGFGEPFRLGRMAMNDQAQSPAPT